MTPRPIAPTPNGVDRCPEGKTGPAKRDTVNNRRSYPAENESTKRIVPAPKGPDNGPLEHVPFVELYPRLQKQFPVFLRERGLAMMFFLSLDIFDQVIMSRCEQVNAA
jgi:hypothetical protein